jgi:hypothetical protein
MPQLLGVQPRRERIGCHHGTWRDVLMMERRSQVIGG